MWMPGYMKKENLHRKVNIKNKLIILESFVTQYRKDMKNTKIYQKLFKKLLLKLTIINNLWTPK